MKTLTIDLISNDVLVPVLLFVITVLLGLNIKKEELAIYVKQYIVTIYTGLSLLSLFWESYVWFQVVYLLAVTLFASINIGFYASSLEKRLDVFSLAFFHVSGLFFRAKIYLAFVLLGLFHIIKQFSTSQAFTLIFWSGAMALHLFVNVIDQFDFHCFDNVRDKIQDVYSNSETVRKFVSGTYHVFELFEETANKCSFSSEQFVNLLSFIVFIEDRDFFDRRCPFFSLRLVLKRKYYVVKSGARKGDTKWLDRLLRGHSTIEQQITRTLALKDNSYHYMFRRKIFVEYIFNVYFFKAYLNLEKRIRDFHTTTLQLIRGIVSKTEYSASS